MYVIVDIAGQQMKVEKDQKIFVNRLEGEAGSKVDFDQILLVDDNGKVQVGTPVVKNMVVSASIIEHLKGDKVKIFKKKRRKGYQKMNGHRQSLTQILIENIGEGVVRSKEELQQVSEPAVAKAKTEVKAAKPAAKPAAKSAAKPKAAPKKEAEKKAKPAAKTPKAATEKKAAAPKKTATKSAAAKAKKDTKE